MRESAAMKGRRYLVEGRLIVRRVDNQTGVVEAHCRGAGTVYLLGFYGRGWHCSCPARTTCAHLHALKAVTVVQAMEPS